MKWFIIALKKYADFTGRARRMEYWMYMLFYYIFSWVLMFVDNMLNLKVGAMHFSVLGTIYSFAMIVPSLAVAVRRFHDVGKSGWMYARFLIALTLIAGFGMVYLVFSLMKDGNYQAIADGDYDPLVLAGWLGIKILYVILACLPFVIWLLVLLFRDSQPGANKWGPNPKGVGMPADEQPQM